MAQSTSQWKRIAGYRDRKIVSRRSGVAIVERIVPGPSDLVGKTIVFLSDLHWRGSQSFADELSGTINSLRPAWLVFGGDVVSHLCHLEHAMRFFSSLRATSAKVAVLGNWDLKRRRWLPSSEIRSLIVAAEFRPLVNEAFVAGGVLFAGLGRDAAGAAMLAGTLAGVTPRFSCLVAHSPDYVVDNLPSRTLGFFDLVLCGHTHGGQVRLPYFGALTTSSRHWKRFEYGDYRHQGAGARMIVTSGIGRTAINIRFLCDPEIVVVRIVHAEGEERRM